MPAAVPIAVAAAPALIAATGAVIGGKMQSNSAKRAAAAQERSTSQALDYQKSRDTIEDQRYQKKYDLYQQYLADYRARNGGASGGGGGASGTAVPVSIADLVGSQQNIADATGQAVPGSIAANVGGWNDWSRYGA